MTPALLALLLSLAQTGSGASPSSAEDLFEAARNGDRARVAQLLDRGVDVNARTRYDVTALGFAADKGHLEVVRLLVERGADINLPDRFYRMRAIDRALSNNHVEVARFLLERGSQGAGSALAAGARRGDAALVTLALASREIDARALASALAIAGRSANPAIAEMIAAAAAAKGVERPPVVNVAPDLVQSYAGSYRNDSSGQTVTVTAGDNSVSLSASGQPPLRLSPTSNNTFRGDEAPNLSITFNGRGGMVESMTFTENTFTMVYERATSPPPISPRAAPPGAPPSIEAVARGKASPWPAFRGANAAGTADGQGAVAEWDIETGKNVRWKTPIPGMAVSSPIVWGDRVFVTTAISNEDKTFRTGLYGDVAPVNDLSMHTWKVYALDRRSGKIAWEREVFTGAPKTKRHPKSSQANSTPVTDGTRVVAMFGSIGLLVCYDADGKLLWKRDLGVVDSGWFFDPTYQWGHSSSPIIYKSSVILQADQQKGSYLAAFALASGRPLWRVDRPDEISTWATPVILRGSRGDELVTNGTKVRGYDPNSGKLLWTLGPNSEITVGTPVVGRDVVYVTGGYPPVRPVYAVRAGARGDVSLVKGQTISEAIAWSNDREGTYIPSPLLYRDVLYTFNSNGILTAYRAATGERLYRARVGGGGAFAASPVAADGRLYFASEDGDVIVAGAGPEYVELGKHAMKEVIMATPAVSDGLIVIRTLGHVYGIGQ
jgi:outer membrane protein assembly factor BamB